MNFRHTVALLMSVAAPVASQTPAPAGPIPPAAEQMAAAVLPLPRDMRAGARILGYRTAGKLETLREGTNGMTCLALYVSRPDFHVACYHNGLEAFMGRGRELRAQGITRLEQVDSARASEIASGKLKMPAQGSLYTLTAQAKTAWDPVAGTATGARQLTVLYIPFATPESTGISAAPVATGPWLMNPGTPKAHIMMIGTMGN